MESSAYSILVNERNAFILSRDKLEVEILELRSAMFEKQKSAAQINREIEKISLALTALTSTADHTPTIMEAAVDALLDRPDGMTSNDLLEHLNAKFFNGTLVRTSLTPQLSRLKNRDKKIQRRGKKWFLEQVA